MRLKDYVRAAVSTESSDFVAIRGRLSTQEGSAGLVGALAKLTELSGMVDLLKKGAFYGRAVELPEALVEHGRRSPGRPRGGEMGAILTPTMIRNLHAVLGLATEVGELVEAVVREMEGGGAVDAVNLMEECGDLMWYMAVLADNNGFTLEHALERNVEKLRKRYGGAGFSGEAANYRDTAAERAVLEDGKKGE